MFIGNRFLLDDPSTYKRLDKSGFRDRLGDLPDQLVKAWRETRVLDLPKEYRNVTNVVIAGMGGSAIGGELLSDLVLGEIGLQVTVCRDYVLPNYVDKNTLVIISSYSGNTAETILAFHDAVSRRARIVVITTGGQLNALAQQENVPIWRIRYDGEPRTAIAYSLLFPAAILEHLKLVNSFEVAVFESTQILSSLVLKLNHRVSVEDNPAKELAMLLQGKLIVVYGGGILAGVARRWKTQLNENAKAWAFVELLPEAGHNAIAGFKSPNLIAENTAAILLNCWQMEERFTTRFRVIEELLMQAGSNCRTVDGVGLSDMAQVLSLVVFGDYTSYYLSLLNEEDPSPVPVLDYLKGELRKGTS